MSIKIGGIYSTNYATFVYPDIINATKGYFDGTIMSVLCSEEKFIVLDIHHTPDQNFVKIFSEHRTCGWAIFIPNMEKNLFRLT